MKIAALLVALMAVTVGIVGLASPDSLIAARRQIVETPGALYVTGAVRVAMGIVVILAARTSRVPKVLRLIGVVMCLQGIVPQIVGRERGWPILEPEAAMRTTTLRVGAGAALATGALIAFAVTARPRRV